MDWFVSALKKYAVFSGRSQRAEYWYFVLFYLLIALILNFLDGIAGTWIGPRGSETGLISTLFLLGIVVPSISVSVRRLHDTGRSGWWLLLGLVPIIGQIVLLVFAVQDSEPGENRFGPNPKPVGAL